MNILTLSIKQKYFDEILAGKKTHEYREIRPTNAKKYITYLCGGKEYPADASTMQSSFWQVHMQVNVLILSLKWKQQKLLFSQMKTVMILFTNIKAKNILLHKWIILWARY